MIERELFLGFPVDSALLERLKASEGYPRFFQEYLTLVQYRGCGFIGKSVGQSIEREILYNAEANVYSLLSLLDPKFPFKDTPLVLFPLNERI